MKALSLLGLAVLTPLARAEIVTHDTHVATSQAHSVAVVEVPRFDPVLGTLDDVRIEVFVKTLGGVGWESLAEVSRQVTTTFGAACVLRAEGGAALASTASTIEASWIASAFDGKVDFAGTSGRIDVGLATQSSVVHQVAGDAYWVHGILPHAPTVELALETFDLTHVSSGGPTVVRRGQRTEVEVRVTYEYTPFGGGAD